MAELKHDLPEGMVEWVAETGGGEVTRDDMLMDLAADILNRIPNGIDFENVTRKFPVMYEESMNTVLQQEVSLLNTFNFLDLTRRLGSQVIRYNQLLPVINSTLEQLQKAIKGTGTSIE